MSANVRRRLDRVEAQVHLCRERMQGGTRQIWLDTLSEADRSAIAEAKQYLDADGDLSNLPDELEEHVSAICASWYRFGVTRRRPLR